MHGYVESGGIASEDFLACFTFVFFIMNSYYMSFQSVLVQKGPAANGTCGMATCTKFFMVTGIFCS